MALIGVQTTSIPIHSQTTTCAQTTMGPETERDAYTYHELRKEPQEPRTHITKRRTHRHIRKYKQREKSQTTKRYTHNT